MDKKPNFENLRKTILRQPTDGIIPCYELFADKEIMEYVVGKKFPDIRAPEFDAETYMDLLIEYQLKLGYDYVSAPVVIPIQRDNFLKSDDTADLTKGQRVWVDENSGNVTNMDEFDAFPWPEPKDIIYKFVEIGAKKIPPGMKMVITTTGVLENVQWLMGYTNMAMAIYDCPEVIDALFEKIGGLLETAYKTASAMPGVGMAAMGDDMGFKGGTLFAPDFLKKYVMYWQKKCVDACHANNIPFILHTCGQMADIVDDLIDYVGIDARHSFEDIIAPVEEVYQVYKNRVAHIGGVDIDLLCRGSEEDVRKRVRDILAKCNEGGYVMGTGNSVANYINPENFLAMMDEVRQHNERL